MTVAALMAAGITLTSGWYFYATARTSQVVRVQAVSMADLVQTISAPGALDPETKVDMSAEVSARIVELPFQSGDQITAGSVVVRLDDQDLRARYDSSVARRDAEQSRLESEMARLQGPRTTLANAQANLERQRNLFKTGDISKQALDDLEARVTEQEASLAAGEKNISVLRSQIVASEADIARARKELQRATIIAPIDGRMVRLNAEVGELVMVGTMNNAGTVILTIADLTKMNMNAEVAEADIARVRVGQTAEVRVNAYKDRVFKGVVTEVALARTKGLGAQAGAGSFEVKVSLELGGDQVLAGLAANVDIATATEHGLAVPAQAVVDRKLEDLPETVASSPLIDRARRAVNIVFLMVDGKAVATPVKTGASNLTQTLVLQGLKEGDLVVTGPYKVLEHLRDGAEIAVESDASGSKGDAGQPAARVGIPF